MTDKEIEAGIERACECDCAPPSTGWTVNPFPIIHDYIERLKRRAEVAEKDLERHKRALCCACKASAAVLTKELVKARVDCFLRKAEREIEEEEERKE